MGPGPSGAVALFTANTSNTTTFDVEAVVELPLSGAAVEFNVLLVQTGSLPCCFSVFGGVFRGSATRAHTPWCCGRVFTFCFARHSPSTCRWVRVYVCACARVSGQLASPADYAANFTYGAVVNVNVHAQASAPTL